MRAYTMGLIGLVLVVSVITAGCYTSQSQVARDAGSKQAAAMCTACKTTWVQVRTKTGGSKVKTYRPRAVMSCPGCQSAVESFFKTGKLEHSCSKCGDGLQQCEVSGGK